MTLVQWLSSDPHTIITFARRDLFPAGALRPEQRCGRHPGKSRNQRFLPRFCRTGQFAPRSLQLIPQKKPNEKQRPDINRAFRALRLERREAILEPYITASSQHARRYRCCCLRWSPDQDMRPLTIPRYTRMFELVIVAITRNEQKRRGRVDITLYQ